MSKQTKIEAEPTEQRRCARQGCENVVLRKAHKHCSPECARAADAQARIWVPRAGRSSQVVDLTKLKEELVADIREAVKHQKRPKPLKIKGQGGLHLISPADLHLGKRCHIDETLENYDSKIGSARLREAIDILLYRAKDFKVTEHLYCIGNDLLNVDGLFSQTTAGTYQDSDSRYRKMFRAAVTESSWCIERLASVAPVRVIVVPGNHDAIGSFACGEVIAARFEHNPNVTVDPTITSRVYYRYGKTLMGFNHGGELDAKPANLGLIMATERPDDWQQSTWREFFLGHYHHKKETRYNAADSHNGVTVRILPSLSGTDAWHYARGFIGEPKRCESFLYDKGDGLIAAFTATVKV